MLGQLVQLSDDEAVPPPAPPSGQGLQDVLQLSDDEILAAGRPSSSSTNQGAVLVPAAPTDVKRKRVRPPPEPSIEAIRLQLNKVLCSRCRCSRKSRFKKPSCLAPFRKHMDKLANMQLGWRQLLKQDMDREAQHGFDKSCLHVPLVFKGGLKLRMMSFILGTPQAGDTQEEGLNLESESRKGLSVSCLSKLLLDLI